MRNFLLALALTTAAVAPAHANIVFSDNFDAENGGNTALQYTGFANFAVTGTGVDLVATPNPFGISCSGSCVDLDGSPGPGGIESLNSFAFNAGDFVRFTFDVSGNQRNGDSDNFAAGFNFGSSVDMINYGYDFGSGDQIVLPGLTSTTFVETSTNIAGADPFSTWSIFFTAGNSGTLKFNLATISADNIGPIVDNLELSIAGVVPEPSTWAMMIFGFGLTGAAMRRSRKSVAKPALA